MKRLITWLKCFFERHTKSSMSYKVVNRNNDGTMTVFHFHICDNCKSVYAETETWGKK